MIIRAASDVKRSESDSDDGLLSAAKATATPCRSVFDPPDVPSSILPPDVFALLPMLFYQETIILPPAASLFNQFVGLALVAVWIYSREKSLATGDTSPWLCNTRYGPWTVGALLCLGHVVSCFYLLFALLESNGDRSKFWLGRKTSKRCGSYGRV
ncbi:unnamed protein product [Peronospora farinosa]|uniref:Uncharacterized protein n=1 Tax=Peronospora farinosa TaxID=134698 RepID=A0ABN8BZ94_9STRA|nr:unnamed protein product [Peronospora farinosa]